MEPRILCIDGHNFLHRARSGFTAGQYAVIFNFFRALRAQVEQHKPSRVYVAMEGHPKARHEMLPFVGEPAGVIKPVGYKANRTIEPGTAKADAYLDFVRQAGLIEHLLSSYFPVSIVRHPDHEADDTIYNLIDRSSRAIPWLVLSNDSDFIQLFGRFGNVQVYNPMTKDYMSMPPYDYVMWKALRGDGSDNVPGIPGVGDKTAEKLVMDPDALYRFFDDPIHGTNRRLTYERNLKLISFADWSDEEAMKMTSSAPTRDWEKVHQAFEAWGFKSLLKEATWAKFVATFDPLWG